MTEMVTKLGTEIPERLSTESTMRSIDRIYDMTKTTDTGRTRTWIGINGFLLGLLGFYFGTGHVTPHPGAAALIQYMPEAMLSVSVVGIFGDGAMASRYFWLVRQGEREESANGSRVKSFGLLRNVLWIWDFKYQYTYVAWAAGLTLLIGTTRHWW